MYKSVFLGFFCLPNGFAMVSFDSLGFIWFILFSNGFARVARLRTIVFMRRQKMTWKCGAWKRGTWDAYPPCFALP